MQRVEIGHRIVEARAARGLSRKQLADMTGHATRTIAAWEANTRHPRPEALAQLACALGHDISWFYASHDPVSKAEAA